MTTWYYKDYKQWIQDGCKVNDKVTILNLSKCNLTDLSKNIGNLINLQVLYCEFNKYYIVPMIKLQ